MKLIYIFNIMSVKKYEGYSLSYLYISIDEYEEQVEVLTRKKKDLIYRKKKAPYEREIKAYNERNDQKRRYQSGDKDKDPNTFASILGSFKNNQLDDHNQLDYQKIPYGPSKEEIIEELDSINEELKTIPKEIKKLEKIVKVLEDPNVHEKFGIDDGYEVGYKDKDEDIEFKEQYCTYDLLEPPDNIVLEKKYKYRNEIINNCKRYYKSGYNIGLRKGKRKRKDIMGL